MKTKIWYLDNSGFAVESKKNFYIFDYYNNTPAGNKHSLENGVINPDDIKDKNVYVFSSHSHPDHFNPIIFRWKDNIKKIKYLLSHDIIHNIDDENIYSIEIHKIYNIDNIKIITLDSTDMGTAFYIDDGELKIFHAGDLNWWHWKGETKEYNKDMEEKFKDEIERIEDFKIDIAFIPVDPRLEEYYNLCVKHILTNLDTDYIFPMHFQSDYDIFNRLKNDLDEESYKKIIKIDKRGQSYKL